MGAGEIVAVVKYGLDKDRLTPEFFADGSSYCVWTDDECNYKVYVAGEMKVDYTGADGNTERIYEADDFISAGLDTADKIKEADDKGQLEWHSNAWFEVINPDVEDGYEFLDEVYFDLAEAIERAWILHNLPDGEEIKP